MASEEKFEIPPNPITPESVALSLLHLIAHSEGVVFEKGRPGVVANRRWILESYNEALAVVRGANLKPR